jgi:hypothetical protein
MKLSILKIIILLFICLLIINISYNYTETFKTCNSSNDPMISQLTTTNKELNDQIRRFKIDSEEINDETSELLKTADEKIRDLIEKTELDKKKIKFCENRDSLDNFMVHHKNRDRAIKKLSNNFKDLIEDNANLSDIELSDLKLHF